MNAQQVKAWIFFTDKPSASFVPADYFSPANLARKKAQGLPEYDWYDLPVSRQYQDAVSTFCDSLTFASRWLNAACVYTSPDRLEKIARFSFVQSVELTELEPMLMEKKESPLKEMHQGEINLLKAQTDRMQGKVFRKNGLTGKNITIAIIDGGFNGYKDSPALERLREHNQIKATYDFIKKSKNVDGGSVHGTAVLSCIAGYADSIPMGCASDANILLYRTEKAFNEKISEEEHWMAAMEEADRQGADIINTSLGYSTRRYFQKDMNGRRSILARAANTAAKKGILVVCSAGNEGDISWKIICTPGDADSVLTVGATNPWTGIQASWSSYGPSADQRIKPNVSAFGYAMTASGADNIEEETGTSFSSPLVAGFAACVKQQFPNLTAMELMEKIERSGDLYPYYDFAHGYGVPQAGKALAEKEIVVDPTFEIIEVGDSLKVMLSEKSFYPSFLQIRGYYTPKEDTARLYTEVDGEEVRKSQHFSDAMYSGSRTSYIYNNEPGYFYYRIKNEEENRVTEYGVLNVRQRLIFKTSKTGIKQELTFHYRGYTKSVAF